MLKGLKYKLMLKLMDISEMKDSTHTIYWLTKSDSISNLKNLQTRWKKLRKYWEVGIKPSINDNVKRP